MLDDIIIDLAMMTDRYYNVSDFNSIYFESPGSFEVDSAIKDIFSYLSKNIIITDVAVDNSKKTGSQVKSSGFKQSNVSSITKKRPLKNSLDWETVRVNDFKVTVLETSEGFDKQISEMRALLNKISSKNYETQRDIIMNKAKEIFESDDISEDDKTRVALSIIDISRSNKFYSELYAELCKSLSSEFILFKELLPRSIELYKDTLANIHYIDHNVDYDGFCNYTKTNDLRKANASFIVNLMKQCVLEKGHVLDVIVSLIKQVQQYIDEDNRTNEVDEITENLHLFITQSKSELSEYGDWSKTVLEFINDISKMKSKDHVSLSARAVFKYMDICDDLKKL